ncbi:lysozyme [Variovorax sp. OV700]|uniref:lysozyme n=1 Tax=Variovorax sp. OV700 TaxID=1882826 RepID=UPI0008827734|nr:lysozyme [Variovorax sp. OV700]SDI78357.1 lysozyme [Variovorax sp. OV700]
MNEHLSMGLDGHAVAHYFEDCKLRAYPDPGSPLFAALRTAGIDPYSLTSVPSAFAHLSGKPWTIGRGDTGPGVVVGLIIGAAEADRRYARRMSSEFEPAVRRAVDVPLVQRQFDALVSIFYNGGVEALSTSTLVRMLNRGDRTGAAAQFPRWNKSGGKVMKGLQRRREAERLLFLGSDPKPAIAAALAKFP